MERLEEYKEGIPARHCTELINQVCSSCTCMVVRPHHEIEGVFVSRCTQGFWRGGSGYQWIDLPIERKTVDWSKVHVRRGRVVL
jgi:hypothetical protein